jgi:hypothetical protein
MNANSRMRATLHSMALVGLSFGCGGGIPPSKVADEAHTIAAEAVDAVGQVKQCKQEPDGGACEVVDTDLCNVIGQAQELEDLALDAGFKPAVPVATLAGAVAKTCPKK